MAKWSDLKAAIADVIKTNGNQEITGRLLQNVLNNIVSSVGENSTFAGIATPSTNPGTPDGPVFYLATTPGTYSNFNGIEIATGEAVILEWKGSWVKKTSGFATQKKLAELEANNNNLTLLDGYSSNDVKVIENFQYVRIKNDIDISDLRVATVYNDASIPKRIIIKYSNGAGWKFMDMTSNYYSDDDIELYYNWDKHTDNINYTTGLIGILESSKNISINNSLNSLLELSIKPYFSFNGDYFGETIKASELLREIYVDEKLNKDLFFCGVRIMPSNKTKLQIAFILESESLYWCEWQVSINEIGKCIHLNSTIGGTKIYVVVDLSKDFFWNLNRAKLNDNIYKIDYSPYIFSNIITKNTTSFVYSENNTENELKILSCFKQIKILSSYQDLCINTIYNTEDIPKRMIIRTFDNSIKQLIDFSDNHYEGDTKLGYVIIDFDWNYFIANCTNINSIVNKHIIIKSDAFIDKLYDNIKEVKENEKSIKELKNLINAISEEIQDKNLVIMGDSIMMLMRTNSVPSNTVTYQDTEGITYDYSLLTNKNGHLYVTSTLQDGNVIETSKIVDIVNSSQAAFDAQNWEALKQKLGVKNLYNFGLGGAVFAERQVVTSYPYPDGNGWTTDLPNEVRWLIRRYTEGYIEYPDCIVIWLGTNGAGKPSSDNYNEIMTLTYDELNSDEHYADRKTLYGGLRWSLETLYRTFQYATIILVTPVQTNLENYRTYDKLTTTANAIKKMAGRYSCMVFDALNEIGVVDFFEKSDGSGYFLYDGVHPNSKGKILWKNYLAQKLKSLFFAKRDL